VRTRRLTIDQFAGLDIEASVVNVNTQDELHAAIDSRGKVNG